MPPKKKSMPMKPAKPAAKKMKPVATVKPAAPVKPAVTVKPVAVPEAIKTAPIKTAPMPKPAVKSQAKTPTEEYFYANGKRKTAISRVRLISNGKGIITVNDRAFENYFPTVTHQQVIRSPLKLASLEAKFDVSVKTMGGGVNAQAEAIRHGVSKALLKFDPGLRLTLKRAGFLTRDSRVKERKKPGLHRARRAPQFSKR